ncbi:MAG: uroporphyrinogen decarboxylase [Acidobacteria bacterium]|nr:uroporphyrinogen decarboxylase [Acidobacteriota bacterium]
MTSQDSRFIKACRKEQTDCTPVWFMRQAGRYMKAYRAIRKKYSLIDMFKNPDLVAEITLQPVKEFSIDAAIIFADILLPLEGMGIGIEFPQAGGPVIHNPVRKTADVESLRIVDPVADLDYVLEGLRLVRSEIDGKIPLIGFAGAPFTLASYAIEGGSSSNYLITKNFMYRNPDAWDLLMKKLSRAILAFLKAQVEAGAQVVQIFDSWVGCLSPEDYGHYVFPHMKKILNELRRENIPSINFGTGTAGLLPLLAESGGDIVGVDWRISLDQAWNFIRTGAGIQGNLDPVALMAPPDFFKQKAAEILDKAAGRPGHIFNLGHGILPSTPEDSVKALADYIHEYSATLNSQKST